MGSCGATIYRASIATREDELFRETRPLAVLVQVEEDDED